MIKNENDLINHRLTWLGTFQGLLLAALAFAWDKRDAWGVVTILCVLGALVALSTGVATWRANQAIKRLDALWDRSKPEDYSGPDVEGVRSHEGWLWFLTPGYFIPWLFLSAWIAIAFIYLRRCGLTRVCSGFATRCAFRKLADTLVSPTVKEMKLRL